MGGVCSWNGGCRILVTTPEGKRLLVRPRCRRVDDTKMNLREIECGGME
jgi:hypothetical protein